MSPRPECAAARDLAPEIALGVADGSERAEALRHIESCAECRGHLQDLSRVADEVLLLAPEAEPPAGFESRVLERLSGPSAPARPRWRRIAPLVAAAALGAAAAFGGAWWATAPQREFATFYERALASADGSYFGARSLIAGDGRAVGNVFAFAGEPSWLFVVITDAQRDGRHRVAVELQNGDRIELGSFRVEAGRGSLGTIVAFPLEDMGGLRIETRRGNLVFTMESREGD